MSVNQGQDQLQGRLFSYGDTQRYRLGINHTQLPVNRPHATTAQNYGRDGAMRGDGNGGRGPNYEPNSFSDAPKQSNEPVYAPLQIHGWTGSHQWQQHPEDTDFAQAGDLYRLMDEAAKERLIQSIAGGLGAVTRQDIIDRSVSYFRQADADYGARLEKAIQAVQAKIRGDDTSVQIGKPAHDASRS
ncbi:catalase-related domain-containing protein [Variovorax sp.]|uniref:catalase-related domain-containing protein n=1 Tax=Variovorax sp. TaxID=1871043 RepID=UPI001385A801|nr:catalase-related domain-containing protein [Variovorax sp.]KAF1070712.1 MAG: Bromoperoxidase-catalase [Variovorax sp.]